MINSLLKLEKLRSDGYTLEYKMCNLYDIAVDVRSQLLPLFPHKDIDISGNANIRCDAYLMFEALVNIVKNACEHTAENGNITLSIENSDSEAIIRIEDDGGGVSVEALPRLFERFYRSNEKHDVQGVGLGLNISKAIVSKHHGSIFARNS